MLLTLDMGNTDISLGVFSGEKLLTESRIATDPAKSEDSYAIELLEILALYRLDVGEFEGAILSSVVPPLDGVLRRAVKKAIGCEPLTVEPGIKTGLNIRIDNPAQLGPDLLVGAVAATAKYGAPCIIWDLGTATTLSVVDKRGDFRGGAIMPGVTVSFDSLTARASLLPRIRPETPKRVIGANSVDSMRSGAVFGTASMMDGMCDRVTAELGYSAPIVATGGLGREIVPHCFHPILYDGRLLADGLRLLYQKNKKP